MKDPDRLSERTQQLHAQVLDALMHAPAGRDGDWLDLPGMPTHRVGELVPIECMVFGCDRSRATRRRCAYCNGTGWRERGSQEIRPLLYGLQRRGWIEVVPTPAGVLQRWRLTEAGHDRRAELAARCEVDDWWEHVAAEAEA